MAETQYKHDVDYVVLTLYNLSLNPTGQGRVGLLLHAITLLVKFEDLVIEGGRGNLRFMSRVRFLNMWLIKANH